MDEKYLHPPRPVNLATDIPEENEQQNIRGYKKTSKEHKVITEEQDRTGWAYFAEGRMTK